MFSCELFLRYYFFARSLKYTSIRSQFHSRGTASISRRCVNSGYDLYAEMEELCSRDRNPNLMETDIKTKKRPNLKTNQLLQDEVESNLLSEHNGGDKLIK